MPCREYTVKQWAARYGVTPEHVRRCCRGDVLKTTQTGYACHLPAGWRARNVHKRLWLIQWVGEGDEPEGSDNANI